jgi:O-antigen ligase
VPRKDLVEGSYAGEQVQFIGVHNYLSILALEVGFPGLMLFTIFSLRVLAFGLRAIRGEASEDRRALISACYAVLAGIIFSFPFGGAIIGWPGEYFWILAAIIMRLGAERMDLRKPGEAAVAQFSSGRAERLHAVQKTTVPTRV